MAKLSIIFMLLSLSTLMANSKTLVQESKAITTQLRLYVAEIASGPDQNVYEVARASISTTRASFGRVYVEDAVMSVGPGPNTQPLGRAQGTITNTGLFEPADVPNLNFRFTAGKYKGSTLIISGQRLSFVKDQEIPIAGGTGFFRGARGYATSNFISYDPTRDTYNYVYDLRVVGINN